MDAEEKRLWQRYARLKRASLREETRNQLCERYLTLAGRIAEHMAHKTPANIQFDELYSAAYEGLLEAIPRFDIQRGAAPSTHLAFRIRGSVIDYLREQDTTPRLVRTRQAKREALEAKLNRKLSDEEASERLGGCALPAKLTFSLSTPLVAYTDERCITLADTLKDNSQPQPDGSCLSVLLKGLNKRDRLIVLLYHIEDLPMKEVAEHLGVSESRISQQLAGIMDRLRNTALAA